LIFIFHARIDDDADDARCASRYSAAKIIDAEARFDYAPLLRYK